MLARLAHTLPLLLPVIALSADARAPKVKLTPGKATSYLTGPLREDGTVDYVKGLDEILGKGVTKENNLFVGLLKVSGTGNLSMSPKLRAFVLQRYGLSEMPDAWIPLAAVGDANNEWDTAEDLRKAPWTKGEHPKIAQWLAANEASLAHVTRAATCERYMVPLYSEDGSLIGVQLPSLGRVRTYATALAARATLRLGAGDIAGCQQDILAIHRLGRLMSQGMTIIEKLVGVAIEALACDANITLANSGKLTAKEVAAYLKQIDALPELRPVWESVDLGERCSILDQACRAGRDGGRPLLKTLKLVLDVSADTKPSSQPLSDAARLPFTDKELAALDYDVMLKIINHEFDLQVAALRTEDAAARAAAREAFDRRITALKEGWWKEFAESKDPSTLLAHLVIGTLMADPGRAAELEQRARVHFDQARIALALAAYRSDHRAYPDSLDALAAGKYLGKVPLDRFGSGKGLHYRREAGGGYTLYSVGENLKDDGGKAGRGKEGDIVISGGL